LDRKGAQEISVLQTEGQSVIADYVVVATGTSSRHMQTLLDSPCDELKKLGFPPLSVDTDGGHWYLADLGDVVLHVFDEQGRNYFDLEGFLKKSPRIDWADVSHKSPSLRIVG
jgi:ribosome-associated protein